MPYRKIDAGATYHVYNRATLAMEIFKSKRDYFRFVTKLKKTAELLKVKILSYCVMPTHFHLLLREPEEHVLNMPAISALMQRLVNSYTKYYSLKYKHSGVVFQGKYKAKAVTSDEYYLALREYILDNPVKKGFVRKRQQWMFSESTPDF